MTINLKIRVPFAETAHGQSAEIIVLHPTTKASNEALRLRQYAVQKEMYDAAREAANERETFLPAMLSVQHQPVREISATHAEQAAMQGEKGFAFKL